MSSSLSAQEAMEESGRSTAHTLPQLPWPISRKGGLLSIIGGVGVVDSGDEDGFVLNERLMVFSMVVSVGGKNESGFD